MTTTHDDHARVNPWAVLAVLCLGLFMTLLDLTIVNIAIPSIIDGLAATLDQILWVLNAYSLVFAVLLITSGRLGDLLGPRNLFVGGLAVFTAASALSGLAHDPTQLILARAAQGLGAALMSPQSLPLITSLFPPERRGAAFGMTGALGGLAVVAGPTLGGLIVTHWGWRWIFYVNLPVGLITLALALVVIPDLRPGRRHRLDLLGVALATAGLFGVVFGLIEGQRYDWGTVWSFVTIPAIIGAGVVLLLAFLASQALRQGAEPLLPFAIFRDRNYALMTVVLLAMGFAMLGLFLPLTIYFQSVLGLSALAAGLTIAPQALAMMVVAPASGILADRFGGKVVLIPGLALFAIGMADIGWIAQADSGRWSFLPGLLISGVGMGCVWSPVYSIAMRDIEPRLAGVASGVISTIQELGGVLASAIVGALLQNRLALALHDRAVQDAAQLPAAFRDQFVAAFSDAAKGGLAVGAGQTGGSLAPPPGVPAQVVQQLQVLAHDVFTHAFVVAMRPTLVLPIVVVLLAALACFAVQRRRAAAVETPAVEEAVAA
ncbi:MAG TPA: DHA2 family efflux MFS transporter permease subunit [Thermomicrobiales bacterium]|nr:DHA2 family efflux MFS transporter permease subunit [Thermomicrobiales bacterium]